MRAVLRVELKRSLVLPLLPVVVLCAVGYLQMRSEQWAASWPGAAQALRASAPAVLPLVLGLGIWHGSRERRAGVGELFAATSRPRASRLLPAFLTLACAAVLVQTTVNTTAGLSVYSHVTFGIGAWVLPLLVGLLIVAATALLGAGLGRLASPLVTVPLCVVGLYVVLITSGGLRSDAGYSGGPLLDTLYPTLPIMDDFHRVLPALSAAQILWFAGLAATGVLLALAGRAAAKAAAVLPAAAGLLLGVLVAPSYPLERDRAASAPVCAPSDERICVSQVHAGSLPSLTGPAGELLDAYARVPGGAVRVHEDTRIADAEEMPGDPRTVQADIAGHWGRDSDGSVRKARDLLVYSASYANADLQCLYDKGTDGEVAATGMAMALMGTTEAGEDTPDGAADVAAALLALPEKERNQRIAEGRAAGWNCQDPAAAMKLGDSR